MSVLTGVCIKRVNFRENIWAFPRRDKRNCLQYPPRRGGRIKRVSVEWGCTVLLFSIRWWLRMIVKQWPCMTVICLTQHYDDNLRHHHQSIRYLGFLAMFPQTQTDIFSEAHLNCKFWVSGSTSPEAFLKHVDKIEKNNFLSPSCSKAKTMKEQSFSKTIKPPISDANTATMILRIISPLECQPLDW